ncbi:hypothetical protein M8J75_013198 [Diaphorina citri]|nr:hypothetical protein M8J75_013198 [Diaphorina citri]
MEFNSNRGSNTLEKCNLMAFDETDTEVKSTESRATHVITIMNPSANPLSQQSPEQPTSPSPLIKMK